MCVCVCVCVCMQYVWVCVCVNAVCVHVCMSVFALTTFAVITATTGSWLVTIFNSLRHINDKLSQKTASSQHGRLNASRQKPDLCKWQEHHHNKPYPFDLSSPQTSHHNLQMPWGQLQTAAFCRRCHPGKPPLAISSGCVKQTKSSSFFFLSFFFTHQSELGVGGGEEGGIHTSVTVLVKRFDGINKKFTWTSQLIHIYINKRVMYNF